MAEFDMIRRLQQIVCGGGDAGRHAPLIGIGDDAAVLEVPPGQQLVVTTDTLVAGTHFRSDAPPRDLGHKSLAVNLSDLAAMGAEPAWFLLALTLPESDSQWLDEFALGIAELAERTEIALAGGDTTCGPLSVTITAMGLVDQGQAITRSGAAAGDLIVVSGLLGDAALALQIQSSGRSVDEPLRRALDRPEPRLELGRRLRGLATAAIDISDGLTADLGHILRASGVGAEIDLADLPCSRALRQLDEQARYELQLTGGDDYELCFTLAAQRRSELEAVRNETGLALPVIGRITGTGALVCRLPGGGDFVPARRAYEHFAAPDRGGDG
jgi:thiamine-monophosphate kinase